MLHKIRVTTMGFSKGPCLKWWPTLSGCKSVGRAVRESRGRNGKLILQSTAMRVAAVVPFTSAIGFPTPTAS